MNLWTQDREMSQPWSMHTFQEHINNETSSAATFDRMWAQMQKIIGKQLRLMCLMRVHAINAWTGVARAGPQEMKTLDAAADASTKAAQATNATMQCRLMVLCHNTDCPSSCCFSPVSLGCRHLLLDSVMVSKTTNVIWNGRLSRLVTTMLDRSAAALSPKM